MTRACRHLLRTLAFRYVDDLCFVVADGRGQAVRSAVEHLAALTGVLLDPTKTAGPSARLGLLGLVLDLDLI